MSRYIDADKLPRHNLDEWGDCVFGSTIDEAPSIDLDDYVPKEFHDKTCEAMAKAHQEEIANMVSVVRCRECKHKTYCYGDVLWTNKRQTVDIHKDIDFCSFGEREGE